MQNWLACGYSDDKQHDIRLLTLDVGGQMTGKDGMRLGDSPSCLAVWDDAVYVGCETPHYARVLRLHVQNGRLTVDGQITLPDDHGLCHLACTPYGVVGSCYGSGAFFCLDHDLSAVLWRHAPGGHAHWATLVGDRLVVCNLGADAVEVLARDGRVLGCTPLPAGSGPRQYLPMDNSHGCIVCENGNCLIPAQLCDDRILTGAPIPMPVNSYPAGACLSPDGSIIVPVRGDDHVVVLKDGMLRHMPLPACGKWPRSCACSGDTLLVAGQRGNTLLSCRLQGDTLLLCDALPLHGAACMVRLND